MTLVNALADRLSSVTDRRGFLGRVAMWGAAVVTAPTVFLLTPTTAYATVCRCAGQACHCSDPCCRGYTEFCCTITGENACPPGGILGGWWKVDRSSFCGGHARYYMDCHLPCGDCSCGGSGICRGSCNGTPCECGNGDCGNRKTGCLHFRYGNCNNDVRCLGPILCRVVSCTHPWEIDPGCTKVSRTDNRTRYHDSPCLHTDIDPVGALESATTVPHSITVGGWAFDVDADGPVGIRVYVDGELATEMPTDIVRDDVRRVYGTKTDLVGFQITVPVAPGTRRVCV
ncbi:MAG TPA: twin-arginine translocation signal domain-containing protein, partial [Acidimicrobiia bacterium]|nr:twin-arginine translocation signal domain-containing protein [Acidimicrobiia bacterium]